MRQAGIALAVGLALVALALIAPSDGWWGGLSVGVGGCGLGFCFEAAYLAWRGYPLGERPSADRR